MERFIIMTVGKTHSGKTTFAKGLQEGMKNAVLIDQDNHDLFLSKHYQELLPQTGPNDLKHAITQTIVEYAVRETSAHLMLCNANLNRASRTELLSYCRNKGFFTMTLRKRMAKGNRDTAILRTVPGFEQVVDRQMHEASEPLADEADYLFVISDENDVLTITERVLNTIQK